MIKVPADNKKWAVSPTTDFFGNVWYTKNINFDEAGYAKLSARTALLYSSQNDANFGIVPSFGRVAEGQFNVNTTVNQYETELGVAGMSVVADTATSAPTSTGEGSRGRWFNQLWHVTSDFKVWVRAQNASTWTDSGIVLTSSQSNVHCMEVFRNRGNLCIGDGNLVRQVDTTYTDVQDLSLPKDFQVVKMAYANNRMGIVTRMANQTEGENQDAFFFIWDGITAVANTGIPVGSDQVLDIVAYKSSWVILTRKGQLLYFNGAGWTTLATFPFAFFNKIWLDFTHFYTYGDIMQVDGDNILINVPSELNAFGQKGETYIPNFPTGIYCYDPNVGLYHRYSPSFSPYSLMEIEVDGVNLTTGVFTVENGATIPPSGSPVQYIYTAGSLIGGINRLTTYYIINLSSDTFQLASSYANATASTPVPIIPTSQSTATGYFGAINVLDFGSCKAGIENNSVGGIGLLGVKSKVYENVIFSTVANHQTLAGEFMDLCLSVPLFQNIGYFVISKVSSQNVQDSFSKVFVKYKPLGANDKIIVKAKTHDYYNLPVTVNQNEVVNPNVVWLNNTTFTTGSDISEAMNCLNNFKRQLEVEITNGGGAGQMSQVSAITYDDVANIYTVTLTDTMYGVTAADRSEVVIDTWQKLGIITSSDPDTWKELPLGEPAKWAMIKVILNGVEIRVEEVQIINNTFEKSNN